jgi:2-C-methyl-D-erythritol 4-phosphate cytidylyltransferase
VTRVSDVEPAAISAVVPLDGRGALVWARLNGQPLYLNAVRILSGVVPGAVVRTRSDAVARVRADLEQSGLSTPVLDSTSWWGLVRGGPVRHLVVHDPLCPLAPADLLTSLIERAIASATSVAAVRPVTDTVKTAAKGRITGTIDRNGLVVVASPLVIAADVMAGAAVDDDAPPLEDLARTVGWLRARGPLETMNAPSVARRVDDESSVYLLECVDELHRQLRSALGNPPVSGEPGPTARAPA